MLSQSGFRHHRDSSYTFFEDICFSFRCLCNSASITTSKDNTLLPDIFACRLQRCVNAYWWTSVSESIPPAERLLHHINIGKTIVLFQLSKIAPTLQSDVCDLGGMLSQGGFHQQGVLAQLGIRTRHHHPHPAPVTGSHSRPFMLQRNKVNCKQCQP